MKTIVSILWKIRSLWTAIVRHAAQAVARITAVRRDDTGCTVGTAGRQTVPAGLICPYANRRRLPFLKYASYTARNGIL